MPNFDFSVDSTKKQAPTHAVKKKKYKSPNQKKGDHTRKLKYFQRKKSVCIVTTVRTEQDVFMLIGLHINYFGMFL